MRKRYRNIAEITGKRSERARVAVAYRPAGKQISIIVRLLSALRLSRRSIDTMREKTIRSGRQRRDKDRERQRRIDEGRNVHIYSSVHRRTRSICPADLVRIRKPHADQMRFYICAISSIYVQLRECHVCQERRSEIRAHAAARACVCLCATMCSKTR